MTTTMQKVRIAALASLVAIAGSALAETMKGRVAAVDSSAGTLQLNGITFQTTGETQYQGVANLQGVQQGDRITVEFSRDGARYVVTILTQEN